MIHILTKQLEDHVYRFEEAGGPNPVHAYLICGKEKALLIDGLWEAKGLGKKAEELLKHGQELSMLVTHGHPDHAGKGMEEFLERNLKVYMSEKDWFLLESVYERQKEKVTFLQDMQELDLGDITVQIRNMPGHTPGSLLAYVPQLGMLFTSDAIGAGVLWMQLLESSPLELYEKEVKQLAEFLQKEEQRLKRPVKIYPGHAQQIASDQDCTVYGKQDLLTGHYVEELLKLTEKIRKNPLSGEPKQIDYPGMDKVAIRSISGKLLYDYCYDENKT